MIKKINMTARDAKQETNEETNIDIYIDTNNNNI